MIWNHPIETSIYKWLFGVPGSWENNPSSQERSKFPRIGGINEIRFLGGGFKHFLFPPLPGEDFQFD